MKTRIIFLLLTFLFAPTDGIRPLSSEENQQLKRVCGTKPVQKNQFSDQNERFDGSERRSIYGGVKINGFDAPWSVVVYTGQDYRCSGTLISPRHVLTATHCFQQNATIRREYLAYSTSACVNNDLVYYQNHNGFVIANSNLQTISSNVVQITLFNMCFSNNFLYDDFAVLELQNDVVYTDYVHPACVPSNTNLQAVNTWMELSGTGHNHFQLGDPNIHDPPVLRHGWMKIVYEEGNKFQAEDPRQQNGPREGDSGGSGYVRAQDGRIYIIGVPSLAIPSYSGIFSSVGTHYNQICQTTGIC